MSDKAPTQKKWARWQRRRRALRDSRMLLKETRYLLRKRATQLKAAAAEELRNAVAALEKAREGLNAEKMQQTAERLDSLLEKHLGAARKSTFREYVESIGIAVLIALFLRAFVVEAFKIPSGSMIPTLKVGDHIFVNKFIYGLRIPLTHIKFFARPPRRGEVVVFIYPEDQSKDFIKRIVAVGGDTIAVRDGLIYINGKPVKRQPIAGPCSYTDREEETQRWVTRRCQAFVEELDGTPYRVVHDVNTIKPPDFEAYRVPEGEVFVMGDNRFHSHDSRMWQETSTVPESYIKGKALIVWWSSRNWLEGIRWGRFFDLVHSSDPDALGPPTAEDISSPAGD